jgi:hypothetical protein
MRDTRDTGMQHGGCGCPRERLAWLCMLVLLALLAAACDSSSPSKAGSPNTTGTPSGTAARPQVPSEVDAIILTILKNEQANGFNADPAINNGQGGLWVNWRFGAQPLQTNFNGSGQPDGPSVVPPRHDVLTDLRYIHTLWLYKVQHPADKQFDGEIARYTSIVKAEFANPRDERGWVYDELIDLHRLSGDAFYQQAARSLAAYYANTLYHSNIGTAYKTSDAYPAGWYRVDLALEVGCALIQAGTVFNQPGWTGDGQRIVQFVYTHAYISSEHAFPTQMGNVLLPDGTANPQETIYRGLYGHTRIEGGEVRAGTVAQMILSLLHVYQVTHDQSFLTHATDLLGPLTAENNSLGLWDSQHRGYFMAVVFPGPDIQHPGTPQVRAGKKESGRLIQMLEAFRVANNVTQNRYQAMQDAMVRVAVHDAYYAPGHGYLYEETVDWQPLTLKHGIHEDWVTTEAMGIGLEGLLSLGDSNPW